MLIEQYVLCTSALVGSGLQNEAHGMTVKLKMGHWSDATGRNPTAVLLVNCVADAATGSYRV